MKRTEWITKVWEVAHVCSHRLCMPPCMLKNKQASHQIFSYLNFLYQDNGLKTDDINISQQTKNLCQRDSDQNNKLDTNRQTDKHIQDQNHPQCYKMMTF